MTRLQAILFKKVITQALKESHLHPRVLNYKMEKHLGLDKKRSRA